MTLGILIWATVVAVINTFLFAATVWQEIRLRKRIKHNRAKRAARRKARVRSLRP